MKQLLLGVSLLIFACIFASAEIEGQEFSGTQSIKVKGRLYCGDKPAKNVLVKLVDDDRGPNPDDMMDTGRTDKQGRFTLSGDTSEPSTIDPFLKIYHDCNDGLPCQRRWKFELPNDYITGAKVPTKEIDIGTWNLEGIMPDEERDCSH